MIHTMSSVYQIIINKNGEVIPAYYGNVAQESFLKENALSTNKVMEVPVRGGFANKTPAVEVVFADNTRDLELKFEKGEIVQLDGYATLKITQNDKVYPLQVISYLRVIPQWNIIEKWIEVIILKRPFINFKSFKSLIVKSISSANSIKQPSSNPFKRLTIKDII